MDSYKFYLVAGKTTSVSRSDGWAIPLHLDNMDCVKFLEDWKAGATVENADGSPAPYSDAATTALGLTP